MIALQAAIADASLIRLAAFAGILTAMAAWELSAPRRALDIGRGRRWPSNLGLVLLDTLILRFAFPTTSIGVAHTAEASGWGLFRAFEAPLFAVIASIVLLDLALYLQHVLFHFVPALWRLHRLHHADLDFDVTTSARFHPIEALLSQVVKLAVVAALGAPAVAVLIFELLQTAIPLFSHGNVRFAPRLDRVLRWIVVTPEMHRVHHSVLPRETNSNFGVNLPWWDRLFGTYRALPEAGHQGMTIGIEQFRDPRELRLDRMLLQPFRDDGRVYPLGRPRKDAREPKMAGAEEFEARFGPDGGWISPPAIWSAATPEALLAAKDMRAVIAKVLEELPVQEHEVLTLKDIEGLSIEEICNKLEISAENALVLLQRGRHRLWSAIEAYHKR